MRPPTFSDVLLARLFLVALAVVSIFCTLCGPSHTSLRLVPCLFHETVGLPCPGCGMTRACLSLSQGDVATAWRYHPFSFLIVGCALSLAVAPQKVRRGWERAPRRLRAAVCTGTLTCVLGLWLFRLFG